MECIIYAVILICLWVLFYFRRRERKPKKEVLLPQKQKTQITKDYNFASIFSHHLDIFGRKLTEKRRGDQPHDHQFPVGMRVLAVDDDPISLERLETLLIKCQCHVTTASQAGTALTMVRENKNQFDLVICDIHISDMDESKLLQLVRLSWDLPVIMMSANIGISVPLMQLFIHGGCQFLYKPVRLEQLKNIWQHVIRRKESYFPWSVELRHKFVGAVDQLGVDKAVPEKILELMNVEKLTREDVASHLQKYRLYLEKLSHLANQQAKLVEALGDQTFLAMVQNLNASALFQPRDQNNSIRQDKDTAEGEGTAGANCDMKKPRLFWSVELHRKFVEAVNQLGLEKADPEKILKLMNVEGLTEEHVASYLQKYSLYLEKLFPSANQQANLVQALGGRTFSRMSQNLNAFAQFQPRERNNCIRQDKDTAEGEGTAGANCDPKKPRLFWSIELHDKFVEAVNQLGLEKADPEKILKLMNVEGLTEEHVASYLQKYSLYLEKLFPSANQQANLVQALGGRTFSRMSQNLNSFAQFQPRERNNCIRQDKDTAEGEGTAGANCDPKKPRLFWSIELHDKFVEAVNQLGLEKADPEKILKLMNVEGLTEEHVASHLQALGDRNFLPMSQNLNASAQFQPRERNNSMRQDTDTAEGEGTAGANCDPKKPRLVWSIELHLKFVEAVNQLGLEEAGPEKILELMNVEELTGEDVATQLQIYRLNRQNIDSMHMCVANFLNINDTAQSLNIPRFPNFAWP